MIYVTPKKRHAKKEEKLLKRFWDRPLPPPLNLDGQTARRMTDNSALEKLRCLSAGGANNVLLDSGAVRPRGLLFNQSINVIWGMFSHSSMSAVLGSLTVLEGCSRPRTRLSTMSQCWVFYRMEASDLTPVWNRPPCNLTQVMSPHCGWALSCININTHCSRKWPYDRF